MGSSDSYIIVEIVTINQAIGAGFKKCFQLDNTWVINMDSWQTIFFLASRITVDINNINRVSDNMITETHKKLGKVK